jgi:asparagine synthase (glutamine-hydrolysing)
MFLGQRLLRDTDAASMANALEVRVPFLDHRIWQSAAGLSDRQRFEPIGRKRLLRELTEPEVPGELFDRPKAGFELPIERWLRGRLQPTVDATLRDERLCRSVGLSPTAVADLWRAFQDKAPGIYWSRVWSLFTLLRWCQTHNVTLDNHSAHAHPLAAAV